MESLSRRNLLIQSGVLGGAIAAGASATAGAPQAGGRPGEKKRLKVIVTGGHPGDPEYGCGGTVARYTDLGHEVVLLYLNRGEWPPKSEGAGRVAEAKAACEILKARPLYAGQFNSQAVVDKDHYESFRKILEAERPDAVFTHWPIDNHADHRAISMLVYDAWLKLKKRLRLVLLRGSRTARIRCSSRRAISWISPRPSLANVGHATRTPARLRTGISAACRTRWPGCVGSRAATRSSPRASSDTSRVLTSRCRWQRSEVVVGLFRECGGRVVEFPRCSRYDKVMVPGLGPKDSPRSKAPAWSVQDRRGLAIIGFRVVGRSSEFRTFRRYETARASVRLILGR